jgi:class 3 adenylate cyclase/tetratricopeptide (TPR) repeat protein
MHSTHRKTVTVLFCDLVGSTALGERTDPELLREVMGRYHAELRAILERHGGTVEKFIGDAAMAVFGIPQSHEDDALRAVRAAAEIRDTVGRLGLEARIGLNTGEVIVGGGETLVTGDAVNVAARLEQAAAPGEILMGEATERLVREAVRADPVEPLELKGKSERVPACRLLEVLPDVPAFTRRIDAPFVGRERELDALERRFAVAVEQRSAQLATITGPPGIGKSRLARELILRSQARVLVARCLSYGEGITYWPLADIVSQLGDVRQAFGPESDAELAASRIASALRSSAVGASPEEIAWGFRKLFEALARRQPLIVALDDIHWAEPTLLDLIEYVAAFAQDAPLLLLGMARPELFELRPSWATPKANATLVTLDPLPGADAETLVSQLRDVSDEAKARIVEAAEGNPLFVEQLVAMQAESGNGRLEIPPTIQALLAARIDRLEPEEREVIERASIEGRFFHRGSVAELAPEETKPRVGSHLVTLVRKELIRPDRSQLPGDDGFRFAHALIRDAAYDSIPKRLRADLHGRFSRWLEASLGGDAPQEILGYHLEQAYRYGAELGVPDRSLGERAAEKLAAAARAARGRRDARAAVNLSGRAVELVPRDGEVHRRLLIELADALHDTGELARAEAVLEDALTLAREAGDSHAEWLARVDRALVRLRLEPEGASEQALREGEAAIAARGPDGDHLVLARAWFVIAEAHLMHAQSEKRTAAIEHALEHARAAGETGLELEAVAETAPQFVFGHAPVDEGLTWAQRLLEEKGDIPSVRGCALHVLGHMRARLGDFDGAYEAMAEWRGHFRELGQELRYAATAACVWDVCALEGDWQRGERVLREGYEILEQMQERSMLCTVTAFLGEALYHQGQLDEAERCSQLSEELGASDDYGNEVAWRVLRAKVRAARGELEQAETLAREAVDIAARTDYVESHAAALLDLAEVLRTAGETVEARKAAEEALALYERKGNRVGAARAGALADELSD